MFPGLIFRESGPEFRLATSYSTSREDKGIGTEGLKQVPLSVFSSEGSVITRYNNTEKRNGYRRTSTKYLYLLN